MKHGKLVLKIVLATFIVLQIFIPLRHFLIPGHRNWTEEHKDFSWQMKIRVKPVKDVAFYAQLYPDSEKRLLDIREHINYEQATVMAQNPYMIWQYARFLETKLQEK